jgi:CheY-like chemotaxis protein
MADLLLVEDDELTRQALAALLADQGYSVRAAADGQEALACLREGWQPDCILLDLHMPGMDGRQLRSRQRHHPAWADVPVVVISGDARVAEEAAFLGVADYLRKPVEPAALLAAIRRNCRPRRPGAGGAAGAGELR